MTAAKLTCAWCGEKFVRPHNAGPAPLYCSASHRQAAFMDRHRGEARFTCRFCGKVNEPTSARGEATMKADDMAASFVRVEAIMPVEDCARLVAHLDRMELDAEVRWALGVLGRTFGWTERAMKLGSILKLVSQDFYIDPPTQGDQP